MVAHQSPKLRAGVRLPHGMPILALLFSFNVFAAQPSVALYNLSKHRYEYSNNLNETRPIASVTKIMTAMVALDYDRDLQRKLLLSNKAGSSLPRQKYSRKELLEAMLVKSDNAAAETIAEDYPGGRKEFIKEMNRAAKRYDMNNTQFDDPSGLSAKNLSTAIDVVQMMETATGYWFIRDASVKKQIAIDTTYKKKIRKIALNHTNSNVLFEFDNVLVGKTGYTNPAGWCIGLVVEKHKQKYVVVILGSKNKNERFSKVKEVIYNHIVDRNLLEEAPKNLDNYKDYIVPFYP